METEIKPTQTTELPRLSDDILFDILSKLSVLDLLKYRCVCKSWHSMISDPQFIKTHLQQSTQSRLMITPPYNDYFLSIDCKSCQESKRVNSPWKTSYSYAEVLCSCDGLVLLHLLYRHNIKKEFVLWNPSIRKHVIFSCPYNSTTYISSELYGLCFDSSTNGYKVIILSQSFGIFVWVFDLKALSWKETREFSFSISSGRMSCESGVIVNGALHWIMTSKKCNSPVIVYFDLMEEKFKVVPKPDYGNKISELGLVDLRGWLCVYRGTYQTGMDIWAMEEYGKKESWNKLMTIPTKIGSILRPLCWTNTGEVLVEMGKRGLGVYDPKECTLKTLECFSYFRSLREAVYVESLVLLNDGDDTTKLRHRKVNPNIVYRRNR